MKKNTAPTAAPKYTAEMTFPPDSRFFVGYTWVHEGNPMRGLCFPGDPAAAVERAAESQRRKYWLRGKVVTYYTMSGPDAESVRHDVTL